MAEDIVLWPYDADPMANNEVSEGTRIMAANENDEDKMASVTVKQLADKAAERVEYTGIERPEPFDGGDTEGEALLVPDGPSGENQVADVVSGKWYVFGAGPVQASSSNRWRAYWDGSSWSLVDMGELPVATAEQEYDVETSLPLSGIAVGRGIKDNFGGGVERLASAETTKTLNDRTDFFDRPDLGNKHFLVTNDNKKIDELVTPSSEYLALYTSDVIDRPDLGSIIVVDEDGKLISVSDAEGSEGGGGSVDAKVTIPFFNPAADQEPFGFEYTGGNRPPQLIDYSALIDEYDQLMQDVNINNNTTHYISKRSIGTGVILNQDIYLYSFKPAKPLAKILLIGGTHASEKMYIQVLRRFVRDLSIDWVSSPYMEFLRWNIQVDVLPCRIPYCIGNEVTELGSRTAPETEPFPMSWTKTGTTVTITFNTNDFPADDFLNADTYFTEVPASALVDKTGIGVRTSSDATALPPNGYKIKSVINGRTITITAPAGGANAGTGTMQVWADPNRGLADPSDTSSWENYSGDNNPQNDDNGISRGFMTDKGTRPFSIKDNRAFLDLVVQENYDLILDGHSPADDHYLSYDTTTGFIPDIESIEEKAGAFSSSPFRFLDRAGTSSNFTVSVLTKMGYPMWTPEWGGAMLTANAQRVRDAYRWMIIVLNEALTKVLNKK